MSFADISTTNSFAPGFGDSYLAWASLLPINKNVAPYGEGGIPFPFASDYYWMCVLGAIIGFVAAFGIGANDVANSFATSVGSKTLTVFHAMIIAGIFEFGGAVLLGKGTTETIRKGIVDTSFFESRPDALMIGMLCAITATAAWLIMASALGFPVSTTHSIIGSIMGFALCMPDGSDAVNWGFSSKGFAYNLAAWAIAPTVSAAVASIFFLIIRSVILRNENSFNRALTAFPIIVGFTTFVVVFLVVNKAGSSHGWDKDLGGPWGIFGVSCGLGIVVGIVSFFVFVPKMRVKYENAIEEDFVTKNSTKDIEMSSNDSSTEIALDGEVASNGSETQVKDHKPRNAFMRMMDKKDQKLHTVTDARTTAVRDNAEIFEYRTELAFGYVQVFTACAMAFAHGSNDVANSIGPVASIIGLYNTGGQVNSKAPVEYWVLVLGGVGIVVGLGTLGYKVMRALGVKLVKVTASRGSCIELASAFVVCFGSYAKLPLSTTQVAVGAALGVGLLDGGNKGVNGLHLAKIFSGWILTFLIAGSISAAMFSLIYYGPSSHLPLNAQNCLGNSLIATTDAQNVTSIVGFLNNGTIITQSAV